MEKSMDAGMDVRRITDREKQVSEGDDEEKGTQRNEVHTPVSSEPDECWWDEDSGRVRRKLDLHIVPLLCVSYVFAFLDRSNIGNAKVAGMTTSLHIDDAHYQWLLTIFYLAYIPFQFLVLGYKLFPPSKWMGAAVISWGTVAILQAAAYSWSGLMAARFFIGVAEAAFGTGVALYLSFFYPRSEVGYRFSWYIVGSAIASAIAGSVAYGLQQTSTAVEPWRLIFIVEAAPTILVGVLVFLFLPDSIATARFLTPYEKRVAEARLYRSKIDVDGSETARQNKAGGTVMSFIRSRVDVSNGLDAFKDPLSYINAGLLFTVNVGYSSIPVYLPTILEGMGYTSLRAQAFSAPPYVAAFVIAVMVLYISDRIDVRGVWIVGVTMVGATGYLMLALIENNNTRYGAVWLVVISLFAFIPLTYSWLIANSIGETKKGLALIIFATVGQVGPLLGTRLFPAKEAPYYKRGMFVSAGMLLGASLVTAITLVALWRINHRKDVELARLKDSAPAADCLNYQQNLTLGTPAHRQEQHRRQVDITEHREASVYFRYSL